MNLFVPYSDLVSLVNFDLTLHIIEDAQRDYVTCEHFHRG